MKWLLHLQVAIYTMAGKLPSDSEKEKNARSRWRELEKNLAERNTKVKWNSVLARSEVDRL